jgi:hypothetical protein
VNDCSNLACRAINRSIGTVVAADWHPPIPCDVYYGRISTRVVFFLQLALRKDSRMLKRCFLILIALVLMPLSLRARLQDHDEQEAKSQQGKRTLRIFIEGEPSAIPTVIEELRRKAEEHGLDLSFVRHLTDAPDARVILTAGTGQTWDTNPNIRPGDIRFPVAFAFSAAVILAADGKIAFTVAQSGNTPQSASVAVAKEIIKNLYTHFGALGEKHNPPDFDEHHTQKPGAPSRIVSSPGDSIPGEPGVYYKTPDGWIRLEQVSPSAVEPKGVGTALLTFGLSGARLIHAYSGTQSHLQIRERKPTFYVRGFVVSEQDGRIVRLEKKKDHREILAASITVFNPKAGYSEHDADEVVASRVSSDVVAITPRTELKTGEYLLSFTRLELSYDFGIATEKK